MSYPEGVRTRAVTVGTSSGLPGEGFAACPGHGHVPGARFRLRVPEQPLHQQQIPRAAVDCGRIP